MISVVVRSKNEIRWIGQCIRAIRDQQIDTPVEIILVDNNSTDGTVAKALAISSDINVIHYTEKFRPGRAINVGCQASKGDIIVVISAHCVPADVHWLSHLVARLGHDDVVGTYGRQIPLFSSTALDKRDLWQVFRNEPRIQTKDYFFHNANSAFYKEIWQQCPFDEETLHIEDILWCRQILSSGFKVAYEPLACVYHHHGINHHEKDKRVERTASIFETLDGAYHTTYGMLDYSHYDCVAVIPVFEQDTRNTADAQQRIKLALQGCQQSKLLRDVFIVTESTELANFAQNCGATAVHCDEMKINASGDCTSVILTHVMKATEITKRYPDAIALFGLQYPFLRTEITDEVMAHLLMDDFDEVVIRMSGQKPRAANGNGFAIRKLSNHCGDYKTVFQEYDCVARILRSDVVRAGEDIQRKRGAVDLDELEPSISDNPDAVFGNQVQRPSLLRSER